MKILKILSTLFFFATVFYACQKEHSLEIGTNTTISNYQWQFKQAGTLFQGPIDTAFVDTLMGIQYLTVQGRSKDGKDKIILQVLTPKLIAGTYKTPFATMGYLRNSSSFFQSDLTAIDSFAVTITKIDANGVTGTFNGKVLDSAKISRAITDGQFAASFKGQSGGTTPILDSGQVTLWAKTGCSGTGPIAVSVAGKTGQITSFTATEPTACGASGNFTTTLAIGNYTWTATCGSTTTTGTVVITKGQCTKALVDFTVPTGDYFPTTAGSNWSYDYFSQGIQMDTMYTQCTGDSVKFGTKFYKVFVSLNGAGTYDTTYFRKGGGLYYQYYPAGLSMLNFDPIALEVTFLNSNLAINQTWSTSFSGTINGTIPASGTIQGKILEKAASLTVGSVTYNDVLRVQTTYSLTIAPAPLTAVYRAEQWFARGKGLIKFMEFGNPPTFSTPTDEYDVTRLQVF